LSLSGNAGDTNRTSWGDFILKTFERGVSIMKVEDIVLFKVAV